MPDTVDSHHADSSTATRIGQTPSGYVRAPSRGGRFGRAVQSWVRNTFTREQFVSALRTLLWVAPLTVLIWVYAEREQVIPQPVVVPFELRSSDPDRIVTLREPRRPELTAIASGPKGKVDHIAEALKAGTGTGGLQFEVSRSVGLGEQRIQAKQIGDDPLFKNNGVSLSAIQPEWLTVFIDQVVERDIPVKAPPGLSTLRPPTFDPPTIRVRGAESLLREAQARGDLAAVADLTGRPELSSSEPRVTLSNVKITLPFATNGEKGSIVGPSTVTATIELARPEEYTIDYVSVMVTAPQDVLDDFKVQINPPTIPSVKVTGPKDEIDQLRRPPKPKATFEIPPDAPPGTGTATLHFDLPPHVKLVPGAVPTTVEYTLVKREKSP